MYDNLTVTGLSVVAALVIGSIELAQVFARELGSSSGSWKWIEDLEFGSLGYALVALFVLIWSLSYGT